MSPDEKISYYEFVPEAKKTKQSFDARTSAAAKVAPSCVVGRKSNILQSERSMSEQGGLEGRRNEQHNLGRHAVPGKL